MIVEQKNLKKIVYQNLNNGVKNLNLNKPNNECVPNILGAMHG